MEGILALIGWGMRVVGVVLDLVGLRFARSCVSCWEAC